MKSPAFQFYPADYLADMQVRMLSWASRGLYMDLLCFCWREGWIPADSSAIAQLCNCHDLAIVEPCMSLFDSHPDDEKKLIHKRLEIERNKQIARSNERSKSGKKGLESRWHKGKRADSSATKQLIAKHSSSSSSSSSDNVSLTRNKAKGELIELKAYAIEIGMPESDGESMFDHWEANGWKNGSSPSKDWKAGMRKWKSQGWLPSQKSAGAKKSTYAAQYGI